MLLIYEAFLTVPHDDWYLPSKEELNALYQEKSHNLVGGFASDYYWSSTESYADGAWTQYFYDGSQFIVSKYNSLGVRAVRAF